MAGLNEWDYRMCSERLLLFAELHANKNSRHFGRVVMQHAMNVSMSAVRCRILQLEELSSAP